MTNGEKIQTILDVDRDCTDVHGENGTMTFTVTQDFWFSEYKEPTTTSFKEMVDNLGITAEDVENAEDLDYSIEPLNRPKKDLGVDCISRIETIDYLCKHCPDDGECFKDCDEIKHLRQMPSVTPQEPRWIPASERLPEKDGDYLLFGKVVEDDTEHTFIGMYDACAEEFGYWEDYYDKNSLGFLDSELIEYNKVIAWMPLPKPYREVEE